MTSSVFCRHLLRRGLTLSAIRLSVYWGLILLDRSLHLGLGFLPLIILLSFAFFPEGFLLNGRIAVPLIPITLSAIILVTSFLGVALWTLAVPQKPSHSRQPQTDPLPGSVMH